MRMDQRMKLSPRMIQTMEILQLPAMALEERIEQELEENPTLERREIRPEEQNGQADSPEVDSETPIVAHDSESGQSTADDFNRLDDFSNTYGTSFDSNTTESGEYRPSKPTPAGERDAKMDAMANTAARGQSLTEMLAEQWRFLEIDDPVVDTAGRHLINYIEEDGYLRTSDEDILRQAPADVRREHLQEALEIIQSRLDPPGIGAKNLQQCLLLQIDALLREDADRDDAELLQRARVLVHDHLKDIEMNRLPRIAKATGWSMEQVNEALARLRRLDPRPGTQLAPPETQGIVPDIIVEYDPINDQYVAALNRGIQPSLRISPQYRRLSKDRDQEKRTRDFLARNMSNARWLIDAIDQRNNTLLRVVNAVLDVQRDFFDHGPQHLKPLPMIHVADQLGIHVATVSRAVSEKYMQTPRGIFPLRMFFSGGTEDESGQEMSWAAVQAKLKEIVDHEDKTNPHSDDALVEELKKQGIELARRTVAKYRSQLNIPTARKRKQYA